MCWTWQTVKFKYLGSSMFIRSTLPWTWRTAKSKCLGSDMFVRSTLPWTLQNIKSKCLGSDMFARFTLPWTWLTVKSKYLGSDIFVRRTLFYSLGHAKGGCSFPWVFQKKMFIFMGVPGACSRPDTLSSQKRLGFGWRRTQRARAWHTVKLSHGWVWLAL